VHYFVEICDLIMEIFKFANWHTKEICGFATPVAKKGQEFVDFKKVACPPLPTNAG
jgi:hypothetical protein